MLISIKTISGEKFDLGVEESDTIKSVKEKIHEAKGHDPSLQKLISSGRILDDESNLSGYNIKAGDVLVIMVQKAKPVARAPPAAPAQPAAAPVAPP